jgi:hypothetical protein
LGLPQGKPRTAPIHAPIDAVAQIADTAELQQNRTARNKARRRLPPFLAQHRVDYRPGLVLPGRRGANEPLRQIEIEVAVYSGRGQEFFPTPLN